MHPNYPTSNPSSWIPHTGTARLRAQSREQPTTRAYLQPSGAAKHPQSNHQRAGRLASTFGGRPYRLHIRGAAAVTPWTDPRRGTPKHRPPGAPHANNQAAGASGHKQSSIVRTQFLPAIHPPGSSGTARTDFPPQQVMAVTALGDGKRHALQKGQPDATLANGTGVGSQSVTPLRSQCRGPLQDTSASQPRLTTGRPPVLTKRPGLRQRERCWPRPEAPHP